MKHFGMQDPLQDTFKLVLLSPLNFPLFYVMLQTMNRDSFYNEWTVLS